MLTIATINVAGLRGATITGKGPRMHHGLEEWFQNRRDSVDGLDLVGFQELKVDAEQILEPLEKLGINPKTNSLDSDCEFFFQKDQYKKGHAGVGFWVNTKKLKVLKFSTPFENLKDTEANSYSGRWIELNLKILEPQNKQIKEFVAICAYFHHADSPTSMQIGKGQIDRQKSEKSMNDKYLFMNLGFDRIRELISQGQDLILMGDLNIAHMPIDLKNSAGNKQTAGFLPEERALFDLLLTPEQSQNPKISHLQKIYSYNPDIDFSPPKIKQFQKGFIGLIDVSRKFWGTHKAVYTWWSNMNRSFDNDAGWRIDYQLPTPKIAATVQDVSVDRQKNGFVRYSDHAPVVVNYQL